MHIPTYIPAGIAVLVCGMVCRDTLSPRGSRHQRVFVPIYYIHARRYTGENKCVLDNINHEKCLLR